jgi:hypothetical protein
MYLKSLGEIQHLLKGNDVRRNISRGRCIFRMGPRLKIEKNFYQKMMGDAVYLRETWRFLREMRLPHRS